MGKFEPCNPALVSGLVIPEGWHGVNVFTVPELKGRRRLITEPLLNATVNRKTLPKLFTQRALTPTGFAIFTLHVAAGFRSLYDAIPIPETLRHHFVFVSIRSITDYERFQQAAAGALRLGNQ
eukprot:gene10406-biopygen7244